MFSCLFGERSPRIPEQYAQPQGLYGGGGRSSSSRGGNDSLQQLDKRRVKRFIQVWLGWTSRLTYRGSQDLTSPTLCVSEQGTRFA